MSKLHVFILLVGLLCVACQSDSESAISLSDNELKRVVLLGGTLISSMDNHAFFESAVLRQYPDKDISFRNIGWPADDVFGLARSQFGSAQNTKSWQPPSAEEGFGSKVLVGHIEEANPTTLIIGYGSEVAFFTTEKEFEVFKTGYEELIDFAESKNIKLVLLSPPKHEQNVIRNDGESQTRRRNEWLEKSRNYIKEIADQGGHDFVDLFEKLIEDTSPKQLTNNGHLLNEMAYQKLASILMEELHLNKMPDSK